MKKVIIILSIVFIFVGLSLSITALAVNEFDFEKLANIHYINEEYDLEETINDIEIKEIVNDIEFYSLDELDEHWHVNGSYLVIRRPCSLDIPTFR